MNYPFEFKELLLTDNVLDLLGFGEYWGGAGEYGNRALRFGMPEGNGVRSYCITEYDGGVQQVDWSEQEYFPSHFGSEDFKKTIYFLHELYEDIVSTRTQEEVDWFVEKVSAEYMAPALLSYLKWKNRP
jgi:hypothetical protein